MGTQNLSSNVLLITLSEQPQHEEKLEKVNKGLSDEFHCNVVVDFCKVQMLTSGTISNLVTMDRLLKESGYLLVLCNVPSKIERIFMRLGLKKVFEFAKDELSALQYIRSESHLLI